MHEASLAKALIDQVAKLAQEHGAQRITEVRVTVGEFSGVEPDLLDIAFERLASESPLRGARLVMKRSALTANCSECQHGFQVQHFRFVCPNCDSVELTIVDGEQLMLESVLMETAL